MLLFPPLTLPSSRRRVETSREWNAFGSTTGNESKEQKRDHRYKNQLGVPVGVFDGPCDHC